MTSNEKYEFVELNSSEFEVEKMCRLFEISRSGYYDWLKRDNSQKYLENQKLLIKIIKIHEDSKKRYGSPRITAELKKAGELVNHKRVEKLMRMNGIRAKMKRRFKRTTDSKHSNPIAENILNRDFKAEKPNQKWVSDITYIPVLTGWLYLCTVIDLYSRKVVVWSMDTSMETSLVSNALKSAINSRNPDDGLIFHSDRGSQYASNEFRNLLKEHGFIQSMSRKGNCWDNAVAESFFHTLKTEELFFYRFNNVQEAKSTIFQYIEVDYNRKRCHSYLNYLSPYEFENLNKCDLIKHV